MTHRRHSSRSRRRGALRLELLEDRRLLSGGSSFALPGAPPNVAAEEQSFVYELNRARHDPVAYELEQSLSVDLSYVEPRPPLAVNDNLFDSAKFHAGEMATYDYFAHQSAVTGDWPNKMARDHGYELSQHWEDDSNYIESIAGGYSTTLDSLNGLIVDEGVPSLGHRIHLLGIDDFSSNDREIGVGYAYNVSTTYRHYWAIHATRHDPADTFVTGVVFDDLDGNGRYDLNEGLPGVTVNVGTQSTTTNSAGGWAVAVTSDTYYVTASGGGFSGTGVAAVTVGSNNVEVDFISGEVWGIINFDETSTPPVASDDHYMAAQNATLSVPVAHGVLANDGDAQNDPLSAWLVDDASHGTLTLNENGSFNYVPHAGFQGSDRFTYRAKDAHGDSNLATVTITVARPLGTIDLLEIPDQDPSAEDLWYRAAVTRQGFLTLKASSPQGADGLALALYDANLNELAGSTPVDGHQRINYQAGAAGETFYFKLSGNHAGVELRLANLVRISPDGTQVTAYGTAGDDTFEVTVGAPFVTIINAFRYELPQVSDLQFSGWGGSDAATVRGSGADEVATLHPHSGTLTGPAYQVQLSNVAAITVYGGGGTDVVDFYDSDGHDNFVGSPIYAALYGDGFHNEARGFPQVRAEANADGIDVAKFYDSIGNDFYLATPDYNAVSGDGFQNVVRYFEGVHVYATAGGVDVAKFYDSSGNDDFVATPTYAALYADGFYNRAKFFEGVHAYATAGGSDLARFYDSPANDDFVATPTYAALYNTTYRQEYTHGFYNRAKYFEGAHAYATAGGGDLARLYDSPADDEFYGDSEHGALYNPDYQEEYTSGFYNNAKFFEGVHAYATAGGKDEARLHGSTEDDKFYADSTGGALYRPGYYYNRAKHFEEVYADAGAGGDDVADLHDSPSSDLLEAEGNWARLSNAVLDFLYEAAAFDEVTATASAAGNTTQIKPPLAFSLILDGPWPES